MAKYKHAFFLRLLLLIFPFHAANNAFSQICYGDFNIRTEIKFPGCYDNGRIMVENVDGGTAPYTFQLNGATNTTGTFNGLTVAEYILYVWDSLSCMDSTIIDLTQSKKLFSAPNAFSPNGDGVNDTWKIRGVDNHRGVNISVFNKLGQEVFSSPDYKNAFAWNGKRGSSKLPEATYYYVITVLRNCREVSQSGTVSIVR